MESNEKLPEMLSCKHIVEMGFSRRTAYRLLKTSGMPVVQVGGRLFMRRDLFRAKLDEFALDKRTTQRAL